MTYVLAVIAGIVGAVVGWFVTGALTAWIAGLSGMSDFEGARGMFAFLGIGPIGGLVAMILSAWLVLRIGKGRAPLGHTLARLAVVLGAIALVVGTGIVVRLRTLDTYADTAPPALEFEIRIPAAMPAPDSSTLRVELHTDRNVGESQLADHWVRTESGENVIAGSVPLARKTASRLLVVSLPDQPARLFRLPLSSDPHATATLGPWRRPDHIHARADDQPRAAPPDDPIEMRYRVRRAGDE